MGNAINWDRVRLRKKSYAHGTLSVTDELNDAAKKFIEDRKGRGKAEEMKTRRQIRSGMTDNGGFAKETLVRWGVPYPPPKGWIEHLVRYGIPFRMDRPVSKKKKYNLKEKPRRSKISGGSD